MAEPGAQRLPTRVERALMERIGRDGPLPFAVVMEEALYGESGYYARDRLSIGPEGDFVTGASLSPLYGRATARLVRRLDAELDRSAIGRAASGRPADYLEAGFGNGEHLRTVAAQLAGGPARRILALDRVPRPLPDWVQRLPSLRELGSAGIEGLVFSYELFDALPVHRLIAREGGALGELWVSAGADGLEYVESDLSDSALADLLGDRRLEPGQVADLSPGWGPLYRDLARALERGLLVTCDYGFERDRLLDPRIRRNGTLACYSRQRVHRDALHGLGEQDLTAHVDWTALREAGEAEGLETVTLARQARWLVAAGVFEDLQAGPGLPPRGFGAPGASTEARMLLDGDGMGEEIQVLVQARGIDVERVLDLQVLGSKRGIRTTD
jgi:SAM-dependent MidA family methyltransferase